MIWLTWRQARAQAVAVYAALVVLAAALAATGGRLAHLYSSDTAGFLGDLESHHGYLVLYLAGLAVAHALPVIIGAFWAAPMITRELESGTHRLAWNQTVTRTRWLAVKMGLTGLAAMVGAGLISLVVTWWADPVDTAVNSGMGGSAGPFGTARMSAVMFGARGLAPVGYVALAFAIGVAASLIVRRTVPAMAVTVAVVAAVQIAVPLTITPHLASPRSFTTEISATNLVSFRDDSARHLTVAVDHPGAWVLANQTIDEHGNAVGSLPAWTIECVPPPPGRDRDQAAESSCYERLHQLGYRQEVIYQPADRFWALQYYQFVICVGLALGLAGMCLWRIRRLS